MKRTLSLLFAIAVLASACGGNTESDQADAPPDPTVTTSPTATPEPASPTAAPEPTATPNPTATAEPEPTATATPEPPQGCADASIGQSTYTLEAGGVAHKVNIYLPTSFDPDSLTPVVLNWHGLGSSGPEQAAFSNYPNLAEAEGFIVVSPTGVPGPDSTRNSWELSGFDDPSRDDLEFANALIDNVIDRFCGDPDRIYSTGMSNGALFTSRLVCELADRIAAAASIAGVTHPDECSPSRPVPYIAFHGTADAVVPFDGTTTQSSLLDPSDPASVEFFSHIMPDEFAQFAAGMACTDQTTETAIGTDVVRHDYSGCENSVPLSFYEIADGGHTWPGSPLAAVVEASLGHTTDTINATELSWQFFQEHSLSP